MPPVQKTDRFDIIDAAFRIVREEGYESLNARSLAKKLGVSTQPIFSNFESMDKVKEEVVKKATSFYLSFMEREEKNGNCSPLKAQSLGYVRFARKERNLFKLLFMSDDVSREVDSLSLSETKAETLLQMFVHGVACLIVTDRLEPSEEEIESAIADVCSALELKFAE